MPEVSIIIPVYNNEAYVQKCIDSVKKQSFEEFEAIIVNDGSTDNSRSIIEALIEKDERFHLINQENQGVAAARNRGIDQAKGKYLTFIDGDDYIGRDYLKNLYEAAETAQAQMVICGFCYTGEDGKNIKKVIPGEYKRYEREEWTFRIAATWAHLYLRELWEKYQVRFCSGERGEDLPISLFFSTVCDKIVTLSDAAYFYVQHISSAMHNFRGLKKFNLPYKALEETVRKIQNVGISNSPEFYELFVLRILTTCYFDLSRGAERNKKRELCSFIYRILNAYFPKYYRNRKARIFSGLSIPLYQKIAVKCLTILVRTRLLYPVSVLVCR